MSKLPISNTPKWALEKADKIFVFFGHNPVNMVERIAQALVEVNESAYKEGYEKGRNEKV